MEYIVKSRKCGEQKILIDKEDYEKVSRHRWSISLRYKPDYFVIITYDKNTKKNIYIHRLVLDCPKGMVIDHINHNRLDNRKINLRICTMGQNNMNRRPLKNASSKYKGVSFRKKRNYPCWKSCIKIGDKGTLLGYWKPR